MPHGVVGIVDAALYRLITHVDGILASLGDIREPGDGALHMGIVDGTCLTGRTSLERILMFLVAAFVEGEARNVGGIPVEDAFRLAVA